MPIHITLQRNAHHAPKCCCGKSIIRVLIDPFKERLAEYLELLKPQILALPEEPVYLIGRQWLGNDRINLIGVPKPERMY